MQYLNAIESRLPWSICTAVLMVVERDHHVSLEDDVDKFDRFLVEYLADKLKN